MFDRRGPLSVDGFEGSGADWLTVVSDATAAAKHPDLGDGYAAALTNFRYLAGAVVDTTRASQDLGG